MVSSAPGAADVRVHDRSAGCGGRRVPAVGRCGTHAAPARRLRRGRPARPHRARAAGRPGAGPSRRTLAPQVLLPVSIAYSLNNEPTLTGITKHDDTVYIFIIYINNGLTLGLYSLRIYSQKKNTFLDFIKQ